MKVPDPSQIRTGCATNTNVVRLRLQYAGWRSPLCCCHLGLSKSVLCQHSPFCNVCTSVMGKIGVWVTSPSTSFPNRRSVACSMGNFIDHIENYYQNIWGFIYGSSSLPALLNGGYRSDVASGLTWPLDYPASASERILLMWTGRKLEQPRGFEQWTGCTKRRYQKFRRRRLLTNRKVYVWMRGTRNKLRFLQRGKEKDRLLWL